MKSNRKRTVPTLSSVSAHSCVLCGTTDHKLLCEFPEFTWVSCRCGLIYKLCEADPPVEYQEDYFVDRENVRRQYNTRNRRRVHKSRSQILDVLNHVEPGPLLDVGCSRGYTLQAATNLGLQAAGVDVSEHAVRYCSELGFTAKQAAMERLPFSDGEFQIVIMKHVLEHTPSPREALREIRRVLRPGGGMFIAVPHAGYRKARKRPAESRFFRPNCPGGREHYVYYTPRTLTRLLEEESFKAVNYPYPHLVHDRTGGIEKTARLMAAPFRAAVQRTRSALALYKEFWVVAIR